MSIATSEPQGTAGSWLASSKFFASLRQFLAPLMVLWRFRTGGLLLGVVVLDGGRFSFVVAPERRCQPGSVAWAAMTWSVSLAPDDHCLLCGGRKARYRHRNRMAGFRSCGQRIRTVVEFAGLSEESVCSRGAVSLVECLSETPRSRSSLCHLIGWCRGVESGRPPCWRRCRCSLFLPAMRGTQNGGLRRHLRSSSGCLYNDDFGVAGKRRG